MEFNHNDQFKNSYDRYEPQQPQPQKEHSGGAFATIVIIIVLILLALLVVGLFKPEWLGGEPVTPMPEKTPSAITTMEPENPQFPFFSFGAEPTVTPTPSAPTPTPVVAAEDRVMPSLDGAMPQLPFSAADNPIPDIFDSVSSGVVSVINYAQIDYNGEKQIVPYGSGSGFFVSSTGYILTNAHVVEGAAKVTVKLDDGVEEEATIIGADIETDVAVLKINRTDMPALKLGDSDAVRVGEYVLAIGNPIDADKYANTLTFGIISAKSREITIDSYTNNYMQTDAAINVGNSGGPLLNMQGEVIGINSAKTITAGYDSFGNALSAESIGFALPINQVQEVMQQLITKGSIDRPGIGITVGTITSAMAEANGVPVGASVESVVRSGPSATAGVKAGDIIVEANGNEIKQQSDLIAVVKQLKIGDDLEVRVYRSGEYLELTIHVENKTVMNFDDIDE